MRPLLAALLLTAALPARASSGAAPTPVAKASHPISPVKERKIRDLLHETGADKVGESMLAQLRLQLPAAQYDSIARLLHPEDVVSLMVPIYDRHFDEEELDGLLGFYRSPLGQKLVGEMPAITAESVQAGQTYARQKALEARQQQSDVPPAEKK